MNPPRQDPTPDRWSATCQGRRQVLERAAFGCFRLMTYGILLGAAIIVGKIFWEGSRALLIAEWPLINFEFLTGAPETLHVFAHRGEQFALSESAYQDFLRSRGLTSVDVPTDAYPYSAGGIFPAIMGTLFLTVGSMAIALILGISAAIYLSEFARAGRFIRLIRLSIANLAGVPSIVFGLFGLGMFVLFLGWGQSLIAGCFTLGFMVLPVVITVSEALRSVPWSYREAGMALGATRWQMVRSHVLPYALPGILTSSILGVARVAGETAPILFTAAYAIRDRLPWEVAAPGDFLTQGVMALPYHIYIVASKLPHNEHTARMQYGTAFVFLCIVGGVALISVVLRQRYRAPRPPEA